MIFKVRFHNLLIFPLLLAYIGCGERYYKGNDQIVADSTKEATRVETDISSLEESENSIEGKVVKIADGDTFTLVFENNFEVKVRLNGIDCPERKQAYSNKAKQALSDLIFGRTVTVLYEDKDRYGRVLGEVYIEDLNVNQEMVRQGYAWHFKRYSDDPVLATLEEEAKENKVGLWADPNPVPPWEYRKK